MKQLFKKLIRQCVTDVGTKNDATRDGWVKDALSRLPVESRVLDAGAGQQRYRSYCGHLHYVSQDFCQYSGAGDGKAIQSGSWDTSRIDLVSDINAIPAEDGSFDAVLCTEVLEHVPDPIAALKEFSRLLRPGGQLILTAPFCSVTHMAPYHFYSGFNTYFYEHHLAALGFTIKEMVANGNYSEYAGQELRRIISLYANTPLYIRFCVAVLLRFLGRNRDSAEAGSDLLCYGYHIKAERNHQVA
jgi:ubiquinone/menaquinone biosynthesis C-methylase UbiE